MGRPKAIGRRNRPGIARRILPYAANFALDQAARYAQRRWDNFVGNNTSQNKREMAPLTAEKDVRVVYVKRNMPKGKKRRFIRQVKKFRSMNMKSEASRIHSLVWAENPAASQNCSRYFGAFMGLVGCNVYDTALRNVWDNLGTTQLKLRHATLRLDHMSLNVVVRNTSGTTGGAGGIIDMDVYKVVFTRDVPLDRWDSTQKIEDFMATLKSELRQHQGMDVEVTDGGTAISTAQSNAGTTATNQAVGDILFNNPPFLRYIKILKAYKIQLGVNQTVTFQMRSTRNKYVTRAECIADETGAIACKRWLTQGFIFNINGRYSFSPSAGFEPVQAVIEHYVRYNFKPMSPNTSDTLVYDGV